MRFVPKILIKPVMEISYSDFKPVMEISYSDFKSVMEISYSDDLLVLVPCFL